MMGVILCKINKIFDYNAIMPQKIYIKKITGHRVPVYA